MLSECQTALIQVRRQVTQLHIRIQAFAYGTIVASSGLRVKRFQEIAITDLCVYISSVSGNGSITSVLPYLLSFPLLLCRLFFSSLSPLPLDPLKINHINFLLTTCKGTCKSKIQV